MTSESLDFNLPTHDETGSIIKALGVGGCGGNAVNNMYTQGISGVDFLICNTDKQDLAKSPVPTKIQIGDKLTNGLGAGGKPEVGRESAFESLEAIEQALEGTRMLFITAGLGGGTGTGAAPVIAEKSRELGILTVGIVTIPFSYEGKKRMKHAQQGLEALRQHVDSLLVINNSNLLKTCPPDTTTHEAFAMADEVLYNSAKGIAEIITNSGYINVDFNDVHAVMHASGTALMGMAIASGENRAAKVAQEAVNSPLLDDVNINGAQGILVNIRSNPDNFTLAEQTEIMESIQEHAGEDAEVIFGVVDDPGLGDAIALTVIATGFEKSQDQQQEATTAEAAATPEATVEGSLSAVASAMEAAEAEAEAETKAQEPVAPQPGPQPQAQPQGWSEQQTQPRKTKPKKAEGTANTWTLFGESQEVEFQGINRQEPPEPINPAHNERALQEDRYVTPMERKARLQKQGYNLERPEVLDEMEDKPAYIRRDVDIENPGPSRRKALGRTRTQLHEDGSVSLNEHNAWLYDNVD